MGSLITPRAWDRQPTQFYGLNQNHPLRQALVFAGMPMNGRVVDLVSGAFASPSAAGASITIEPRNGGTSRPGDDGVMCATTAAGSSCWVWPQAATGLDAAALCNAPVTILAYGKNNTASTCVPTVSTAESSFGNGFSPCPDDNSFFGPGRICQAINAASVNQGLASSNNQLTSVPTGKLHFFGSALDGTNCYGYYQGQFRSSAASALLIGATGIARSTQFGRMYSGATIYGVSIALGLGFNRVLTLAEYQALYLNPWALFRAPPRREWFGITAGANNTLTAPLGTLTLTGLVPTFAQTQSIVAPLGTLTLTGLVPAFGQGNNITAPLGTLTLTGLVPTFAQNESIVAPLGTLTLTGLVPTFAQNESIVAPLGTLTLTGLVPTFQQGNGITAPLGTITLTGLVPTFAQNQSIVAPLGTLTLTGLLPTFGQGHNITAPLGTLTLTGLVPTFQQGNGITAPLGTITLTGLTPTFAQSAGNAIVAPLGVITLTGLVPTLNQTRSIVVPLGTLTLVGLVPTFSQLGGYTLPTLEVSVVFLGSSPRLGAAAPAPDAERLGNSSASPDTPRLGDSAPDPDAPNIGGNK